MKSKGSVIFGIIISAAVVLIAGAQVRLWFDMGKLRDMYEDQASVNRQLSAMLENEKNGVGEESRSNRGSWEELPPEIIEKTSGSSIQEDSPVQAEGLAYLTIPYCNFDGGISEGHMIAAKDLADEILDIFEELCNNEYPIESMEIAEEFKSSQTAVLNTLEAASKGANNTTALMYRKKGNEFDRSAYGTAIDLNPRLNPEVTEEGTVPRNALDYKNREDPKLSSTQGWAFIRPDCDTVRIFEKYGWKWRGESGSYGRFEKDTE